MRAELDYCVPLGIPHSVFSGWLDTDRGYALAWKADQRATCSGCGTRADEWTKDPADPEWVPYVSHHITCPGCAAIGEEQAERLDERDGKPLPGQKVYLLPSEHAAAVIGDDG